MQRITLLCLIVLLVAACTKKTSQEKPARPAKAPVAETSDQAAPPATGHADVPQQPKKQADPPLLEKTTAPGLQNVLGLTQNLLSGSEPHGDEGFESLAKLGVTTVVSVDGARPNVEAAHAHGLKYVHIPIGYDGVPAEKSAALARLMRDATGPVYIHCHHGQHRGPAAAAIACIAGGTFDGKSAIRVLEIAGTDRKYQGLWRDVEAFTPPDADATLPELVEIAQVGSMAAAMADIDRHFDYLKLCREANWQTPKDHPDIVPRQETVIVKEGFREAGRVVPPELGDRFKQALLEAERFAEALEASLRIGATQSANEHYVALEQSCKKCHESHRNAPRGIE